LVALLVNFQWKKQSPLANLARAEVVRSFHAAAVAVGAALLADEELMVLAPPLPDSAAIALSTAPNSGTGSTADLRHLCDRHCGKADAEWAWTAHNLSALATSFLRLPGSTSEGLGSLWVQR
jgi:hypothetical protein